MERFRLYKIVLKPAQFIEGDWTKSEVTEFPNFSKAQEMLEEILSDTFKTTRELPIGKDVDTGGDPLNNRILRNEDGITLLRLNHAKKVTYWKPVGTEYEKASQDSMPFSYIVIDNRQDIGQIAIQMNTDAWTDPDVVMRLLEGNLNRMLKDKSTGLQIELRHKWLPSEFFAYIKQRKKDENITVKKLNFEFTNPEFETPIDTAVDTSGHIRQLMRMLSQLGGGKGKLTVDAPQNKELIKRKTEDIKQMVSLVATNGYKLNVEFSNGDKYVCNERLLADVDMPENYISNFKDGVRTHLFEYELVQWLDAKRLETSDYKEDETPRTKPARRNRRNVS